MTKYNHCRSCHCHEFDMVQAKVGDRVKDRLSDKTGKVVSLQSPNLPWHNGGAAFVKWDDGDKSYCHYYDILEVE